MLNTEGHFNSLAAEFETLAVAMRGCKSSNRRIALLQRMRVVIEESTDNFSLPSNRQWVTPTNEHSSG